MRTKRTRPPAAADANTATGQWLRRAPLTDDLAGNLIADMCRDPNVPRLFRNIEHMRGYLRTMDAAQNVVADVMLVVWRRYRKWLDRNPVRLPRKEA
jgi:hypothetical protein